MRIYRYIKKTHVEDFFSDGSLMVSTLERCRQLEGTDIRGDAGEGTFISEFSGKNSPRILRIEQLPPIGTMVLCCSYVHSLELQKRFGVDGCIEILDAEQFFEAVSAALPIPFTKKEMSSVKYLNGRIERHIVDDKLLSPQDITIPLMMKKAQSLISAGTFTREKAAELERAANGFPDEIMNIVRRDASTCKPERFKDESEVRMLWYSADPTKLNHLIKCPEAIKLCNRV